MNFLEHSSNFIISKDENIHTIIYKLKLYLRKCNEIENIENIEEEISLLCSEIKSFIFSVAFLKNEYLKKINEINNMFERNKDFFNRLNILFWKFSYLRKEPPSKEVDYRNATEPHITPYILLFYQLSVIMGNSNKDITDINRFVSSTSVFSFYFSNFLEHIYSIQQQEKYKRYLFKKISSLCFLFIKQPEYRTFQFIDFSILNFDDSLVSKEFFLFNNNFYKKWLLSAIKGTLIKFIDILKVHSFLILNSEKEKLPEGFIDEQISTELLSNKEKEVLNLIELSRKEISKKLGVSENTVQTHIENICIKTNIKGGKKELFKAKNKNK